MAERLRMGKIAARRRYGKFVQPYLDTLIKNAKARSGGDRALADEMFSEAVLKILSAAGKEHVGNPKHFALTVARNAMVDVAKAQNYERKLVKPFSFEFFLSMVDPRPEVELSRSKAAATVKSLLSRAGLSKPIKDTVVYRFGLDDRKPKTLAQTAKHFGIPPGTAASRITSAIKKLRMIAGLKK
ncbi:MAG: sigma-70 family RNA polymerase sigma factor [Candidatus Diapherotrites archaeon]|nr:sigma-70 family RNA polymerase sigma factor [Candidatus Diapherotrites archaeon]